MKKNMTRRNFVKLAGMAVAMTALPGCAGLAADTPEEKPGTKEKVAGT